MTKKKTPTHDAPAAPPVATHAETPADPPAGDHAAEQADSAPATSRITVAITDVGKARALPLAPPGSVSGPDDIAFEPGTIEQFMGEDDRTMRIVNVGGVPHKAPAPIIDPQPDPEEQ